MDHDTRGIRPPYSSTYASTFSAVVGPDLHNLAPNASPLAELGYSPRRNLISYPLQEEWLVPSIVHPPIYTAFNFQQQPDYVAYGSKPHLTPVYTLQFGSDRTPGDQIRPIPCLLSDTLYSSAVVGNASFPINTGLGVFTLAPGYEPVHATRLSDALTRYDGLLKSGSDEQGPEHFPHTAGSPDGQHRASPPLMTTDLRHHEGAQRLDKLEISGQSPGLLPATWSTSVPKSSGGMHYCHHPICGKRFRRKEHLVRHRHTCHSKEPKRFLCEFCGLDQFNRSDNRDAHRKRHAHPRGGRRSVAFIPEAVPIIEEEERRRKERSLSK